MTYPTIERDGTRFALVPEDDLKRLLERAAQLDDVLAYDAAKAKAQELVPAAIVDRLIAGENPIKVWREHRGLTQQQLADACGISKPYVSQIESGAREPTVATLKALAAALAVDIDDLV